MATSRARSKGTDNKRVSSQKHELAYTGRKVARAKGASTAAGKRAVKAAKKATSTVSRPKVERAAKAKL